MSDVLLLQPRPHLWDEVREQPAPPVSLVTAARLLPGEFDLTFLDLRRVPDWRAALTQALQARPLCVALTSGVFGTPVAAAAETAAAVREIADVPLIWGGPAANVIPTDLLAAGLADVVVRGEGEEILLELVRRLADRQPLDGLRGISHRTGRGEIRHEADAPPLKLAELPDVPWSIIPVREYLWSTSGRASLPFETSRGCPNHCNYCRHSARLPYLRYRAEAISSILGRLERLTDAIPELEHLEIVDETFPTGHRRLGEWCRGVQALGRPLTYLLAGATVAGIQRLDDAELALLRRSGCVEVCMGLDQSSRERLQWIGKTHGPEDVLPLVKRLLRADMTPNVQFLLGFPGDTEADLQATVDQALAILAESPRAIVSDIASLVPFPGTGLWEPCLELGFRAPTELTGWADLNTNHAEPTQRQNVRESRPWLPPEYWDELDNLSFLAQFWDEELPSVVRLPVIPTLARLYRPVARWRARHREYRLFLEKWLFDRLARPEVARLLRRFARH